MDTLEKIIDMKNKKGLSDTELEKELGLTPRIVAGWKSKKSKSYFYIIPQIADYFGVRIEYLLRDNMVAPPQGEKHITNEKGNEKMDKDNEMGNDNKTAELSQDTKDSIAEIEKIANESRERKEEVILSCLHSFIAEEDKNEFVGRVRKLARDMRAEIENDKILAQKSISR